MRALLDTAAFLWATSTPDRLSPAAVNVLNQPPGGLEISTLSLGEIAIKIAGGKLAFSAERARQAVEDLGLRILPFTAGHAFEMFSLPLLHRDPFDRQIIAQALAEGIPIVTPDRSFGLYRGLKVIW